jgi:hypothetical protein
MGDCTVNQTVNETLPEVAFYYPETFWADGNWIKNLILFFDGIGLLVPEYMQDRMERNDPAIVAGLRDKGLLHVFPPETLVDKAATAKLAESLVDIITSGALDSLVKEPTQFAALSMSRLGYRGDAELAQMIYEELRERGLAKQSEDGVSIPMHPMVRSLVLVLLAQILRAPAREKGYDLAPAADRPKLVEALRELLSVPDAPSVGHVIAFDLNAAGVDLGPIPIDEVLNFRHDHFDEHRKYARSIRLFVHELSTMPQDAQALPFEERQAEIDDLAAGLRTVSRRAWKKPASFCLSILGATWTLMMGNPIGAILSGAGAVLSNIGGTKAPDTGAYSYLFSARNRYV